MILIIDKDGNKTYECGKYASTEFDGNSFIGHFVFNQINSYTKKEAAIMMNAAYLAGWNDARKVINNKHKFAHTPRG